MGNTVPRGPITLFTAAKASCYWNLSALMKAQSWHISDCVSNDVIMIFSYSFPRGTGC